MKIAIHKKQPTRNNLFGICILVIICILFFGIWNLPQANASCSPIFGGGPTCTNTTISVTSQVLSPTTNHFTHDLGEGDRFPGNVPITFRITLSNTGNSPLAHIVVKDTLPTVVHFLSGSGQFNERTNTLTFTLGNLAPHHTQIFTVEGQIVSQSSFPVGNSCVTNDVSALASAGSEMKDSSQFCLDKITNSPATGPETWTFLALIPVFTTGIILTSPKFLK